VPVTPIALEAERIAAEIHRKLAINLSAEQLAVVAQVLSHRLAIITGGPGTGKTTLLRSISTLFEDAGKRVLLAAPTGRAARRLAEVTGRAAGTIHRLLGYNFTDGGFMRHRDHPLDADAIIVDEASMIDTLLMYHLVDAVPISAVLILVGDVAQLPSVGAGSVLADMIRSRSIPVFYLNKIFRQAQQSSIVVNAHKVRQGEMPVFEFNDHLKGTADFRFIEQPDPQQVADRIVQLCREELPNEFNFDPLADIQVLTPMHKGVVGTINLNQLLQKALNPRPVLVEAMGNTFRIGDKVMHLKNNYHKEVYNGDIGRIMAIDRQQNEMVVDYYGRSVTYDFEELDEVAMAYAVSVHKSQGSEYPAVVVPILTQHYILLHRNLLYTAITRGRKQVILIGTRKALAIALKNDKPQQRLSGLAARLNTN
jgi:exodeoxyribonuclease V alpha subunit